MTKTCIHEWILESILVVFIERVLEVIQYFVLGKAMDT